MLNVTTSTYYFCENAIDENEFFIFEICQGHESGEIIEFFTKRVMKD